MTRVGWSACVADEVGYLLGGGGLHAGQDVDVLLHGELRRRVTEPLAHHPYGNAGGEPERGVGVSQVVQRS